MSRTKKSRVVTVGASAVVALGAITTGVGVAGASSTPTTALPHRASANAPRPWDHGRAPLPGTVGTVTAVSATSLSVKDLRTGDTVTYDLTTTTAVRRNGAAATISALQVGETVAVFATANGSSTAATIVIVPAGAATPWGGAGVVGVVSAVSPSSITVTDPRHGTSTTFAISSTTSVTEGRQGANVSDLRVGDRVRVTPSSAGSTTAASIAIALARVTGQVVSVSGDTIVVSDPQGFYRTILVSGSTTYDSAGVGGSLADVTVGSTIFATGQVDANHTTLDALNVAVGVPPAPMSGVGPGAGGPMGMM